MRLFKMLVAIIVVALFTIQELHSQKENFSTLPSEQEQRIDEICERWDNNNAPGVAVLILNKGEVVYQKNFGLANVERKTPISSKTQFPLAQVSSHFTAVAAFHLIEQEKLFLDQNIKHYLPDMPGFFNQIKVADLLQHSSGLEDYNRLNLLSGGRATDIFTHKNALTLIKTQKKVLFEPGSRTEDSPSNMMILSEVIASASGKSFANFMKEEIFDPLEMNNTFISEELSQPLGNNARAKAYDYDFENDDVKEKIEASNLIGSNNMYSCIEDLIKWEKHLKDPKFVSPAVIGKLNKLIKFKYKGKSIESTGTTFGQIGYHAESGGYKWWMNGSIGGYASCVTKVVDNGFSSYVFSNTGESYTGYISVRAALLLNPSSFPGPSMIDYSKIETLDLSSKQLQQYCGDYWCNDNGTIRSIIVEQDTLRYRYADGFHRPLIPISKHKFQMMFPGDTYIYLDFTIADNPHFYFGYPDDPQHLKFSRYEPTILTGNQLKHYEGTFLNRDLDMVYNINLDGDHLVLSNLRSGKIDLIPVKGDTFNSNRPPLNNIKFDRDENSKIMGLHLIHKGEENFYLDKI